MKFNGISYRKVVKVGKAFFENNAADILTGLVCAGVTATGIFVHRGTLKAEEYLKATENEDDTKESKTRKKLESLKFYIPSIITGAATIGCAIGANMINHKKIAAFAAAATIAETALSENRDKLEELMGEKNLKLLDQAIAEDNIENAIAAKETKRYDTKTGDVWCVIPNTGIVVKLSVDWLLHSVNLYNSEINNDRFANYARFIEILTSECREEIFIPDWAYEVGYNDKQTGLMRIDMNWSGNPIHNERYLTITLLNKPIHDYMSIY